MYLTDEEIMQAVPGMHDCLSDPWDVDNTGDDYGSIPKDMIRLGRAIEALVVSRQMKEMNDLKATISLLLMTGPRMERAVNDAGEIKYGTMLDVLNDYKQAAEAEAQEVNSLNYKIANFKEAIESLIKARDKKLFEPTGDLQGHHYMAREEKQRDISIAIARLESLIGKC